MGTWDIYGLLVDHPWPERPIFGKIRYMNSTGARRKFDVDRWIAQKEPKHEKHSSYEVSISQSLGQLQIIMVEESNWKTRISTLLEEGQCSAYEKQTGHWTGHWFGSDQINI